MFITILDAAKGKPFRLQEPLENTKMICIHRIDMWVGYYNVSIDQTCRWAQGDEASQNFIIKSGLYNFDELVEQLIAVIAGLTITNDITKGLVEISIPAGIKLWLTDLIRYLLGIDEASWLTDVYEGDRISEFTPKRLLIYLKQLSTSKNYENNNQELQPSQLMCSIPLSAESLGSFHIIKFDNLQYKQLQNNIHELDFDFKIEWGNGFRNKLDNHGQPIDLTLEVVE